MNLLYYIPDAAGTCPAAKGKSDSSIFIDPRHKPIRKLVPCSDAQVYDGSVDRSSMFIQMPACIHECQRSHFVCHEVLEQTWRNTVDEVSSEGLDPTSEGQLTFVGNQAVHWFKRYLHDFMQSNLNMMNHDYQRNRSPNFHKQKRPKSLELGLRVHTYLLNALQQATESFQNHPSHNYVPFLGIALTENVLAMTVS